MIEDASGAIFAQVAILVMLAALVGMIGLALRQPLIVSFIAVGILAGPGGLGLVEAAEPIELLAELGIAVLLFLVGLKLDLGLVRSLGPVALTTGLGQVLFTSVIGFAIGLALGLSPLVSLYVAVALTFSSTIIIVKLLTDKREVDSLHGRIALGFLIVQDIVVVLAMIVLSAVGIGAANGAPVLQVLMVLGGSILLVGGIGLFIRYVSEPLLRRLAGSPELLVAFAIGWAATLAASADVLGLSKELGGLLAGVSLASTPYREAIASRLSSVRDFLLLFFFVALGARLEIGLLGEQIGPAIVLSLFVLIGNPLIVLVIMGAMGYRKRTGFLAGLTVAQISEFSLIFMAMGLALGHVDAAAVALVTIIGLITIGLSTYMITYSQYLYPPLEPFLGIFERRVPHREEEDGQAQPGLPRYDVLLLGLGRYGTAIAQRLAQNNLRVLGVDFDPEALRTCRARGVDAVYGDIFDPDLPRQLPVGGAKWAICSVPAHDTGLTHQDPRIVVLQALRTHDFRGRIAVTSHWTHETQDLERAGADLVLLPFSDAAERAAALVVESVRPEWVG
jgi:Kef-type K+ transport system membrane component KefB